tara:strand:+ start:7017 stop:7931 length:915 start_codon:yes stop_codon:yes gene_type:complete
MKKTFLINSDQAGSRLDRWFKRVVCNVPQSLLEKNLRKGKIKINNKKNKSSYKLKKDDLVLIDNLNLKPNTNKINNIKYIATKTELSSTSKIFIENNSNFSVINKPAGVSVQSGTKSRRNILDILSSTKEFSNFSPYAVHRIDKETTGVLIVAKNRKFAQLFTSLFRIRKIHKTYLCIVIGEFNNKKGTFIDELIHYEGNKKIKSKAITHFKVLDSNNRYTLLKLIPQTGRKHQLRKQLLIRGYPILGDQKYGFPGKFTNKKTHLMLHAYKVHFLINDVKHNYSADLPEAFKKFLKEKYLRIFQ